MIGIISKYCFSSSSARIQALRDSVSLYKDQGYVVLRKQLSLEAIDRLLQQEYSLSDEFIFRFEGRSTYKPLSYNTLKNEQLYFSAGKKVDSKSKSLLLTSGVKQIKGEGIDVMTSELHNTFKVVKNIAYSKMVKMIAKELFGMKAPIIASSSYVGLWGEKWSNLRKDNSFIRTNPPSTQVLF